MEQIRQELGGCSVRELAAQFGTPTYFYDVRRIEQRLAELQSFDVVRYAQKACSNLALLAWLRRHGVKVDAVSRGELLRALRAGYQVGGDPPEVVFTCDLFDRRTLEWVREHGVAVNCGSPDMIEQLGAVAPGRDITLRINPGFGHGHSRKTNTGGEQSKHGIWHGDLDECLIRAERLGMTVTGLHMHIGSGTDFDHLSRVCGAMEEAARTVGRSVRSISAGGGLPIPYRPGDPEIDIPRYFASWDATRRRLETAFRHPVRLEIEPGRYLVAESGYLVCEIRAVKRMGNLLYYLVDAGFNALARPILYGAYHPISLVPANGDVTRPQCEAVVGGPLCESGDIFTQGDGGVVEPRSLPAAQVGDFLVLERAGAYGFAMASNYNSHPLPAEVWLEDGHPQLIRERQSYEDLWRGEVCEP